MSQKKNRQERTNRQAQEEIVTRRLILVDDAGRERARLEAVKQDDPLTTLTLLTFFDDAGRECAVWRTTGNGFASLEFCGTATDPARMLLQPRGLLVSEERGQAASCYAREA